MGVDNLFVNIMFVLVLGSLLL